MSKSKTKSKTKSDIPEHGVECIYFKPQRAVKKHLGCVQSAPCSQCPDCAYLAPKK